MCDAFAHGNDFYHIQKLYLKGPVNFQTFLRAEKVFRSFSLHVNIYSTAKETHIFTLSFYHIKSNNILLIKQTCLCMAIGYAAFSCHNAICRKLYADFLSKKG